MTYIVPNMKLIPQTMEYGCWYASAQMLISWKSEQRGQSIAGLIPPELDAECRKIRDDNSGIANPQILMMAQRLGLKVVPPQSLTSENILNLLSRYGPLWANGKTHIVVVAGYRKFGFVGDMVYIFDPYPINIGDKRWMPISVFNKAFDTDKEAETVLLYCP